MPGPWPLTDEAGPAESIVVRIVSRYHPAVVAAALWAAIAVRLVRKRLKRDGLRTRVPSPPAVGLRGGRGVRAALRRFDPSCLERALVQQAWLASVGDRRDVVIGVPPGGMRDEPAHAWVEGLDTESPSRYLELHRLPAPISARRLAGTGSRDENGST